MPRQRQEPRLYLDLKRRTWIIRYGKIFNRTGLREAQIDKAKALLERFPQKFKKTLRVRTIYFVTCEDPNFPIKIGMSSDVKGRMRNIRTALPFEPILMAQFQGTSQDETAIHKRFAALKMKGEWFRRGDSLLQFIASIGAEAVPTSAATDTSEKLSA